MADFSIEIIDLQKQLEWVSEQRFNVPLDTL